MPAPSDLDHLRRAIALSQAARDHGNHPFGAVLVAPNGEVVLEAENSVVTEGDVTHHAETNLVRLASRAISYDDLRAHTLVTSCEPCPMCAGAIFWAGIGRVVYGLSQDGLHQLTGPGEETMDHACRLVFADGGRETVVVGPLLEDEAAGPHRGFWT